MTDRDIMQQALEALKGVLDDDPKVLMASISGGLYEVVQCRDAITALRERLAHCDRCGKKLGDEGDIHTCSPRPEQEPVAWLGFNPRSKTPEFSTDKPAPSVLCDFKMRPLEYADTTPPQRKPLVWLSEEDERQIKDRCTTVACVLRAVKAKLKEKNNGN